MEITNALIKEYPDLKPFLDYRNSFELTIGVILTAQTTDAQVNKILPVLFQRFPNASALAMADLPELEEIIRSTGFFRMKAKNIKGCAAMLLEKFDGEIPERINDLVKLPGVGRKSANVIVGHAFDQPAIAVDTHFGRVSYRLGITTEKDPKKVEEQVKKRIPRKYHFGLSQSANYHGRVVCSARNPDCSNCFLLPLCPRKGLIP